MKKKYTKPTMTIAYTGIVAEVQVVSDADTGKSDGSGAEPGTPETGRPDPSGPPEDAKQVWGCDWSMYEDW